MKKYIIVLLIVCILALSSYIYKLNKTNIFYNFPYEKLNKINDEMKDSLHLFLFFSIKNCPPCLDIIDVLNDLENNFQVIGIVPKQELLIENDLRRITGAKFRLVSMEKYQRFMPIYAPTIVGVSSQMSRGPGQPGRLPARASHRSGRADFPHPAHHIMDSLRF